jgi:hypothetical protein
MAEPQDRIDGPCDEGVEPDEIAAAMAVYSADGQVDDATGGDAAAERLRAQQAEAGEAGPEPPIGPV